MAQVKRQAEKVIGSQPKRQKSAKKETPRTDAHQTQDEEVEEENSLESQGEGLDDDEVATTLTKQLNTLKEKAGQRKTWAKGFETTVNTQKAELTQKIEDAKTRLENKRDAFKDSILPALASAMRDANLGLNPQAKMELPLELEIKHTTKMVTEASLLLKSCETLIACYEELTETTAPPSSIPRSRQQFVEDKEGLARAFHAARRMAINQVQTTTTERASEVRERYTLDDKDEHLARKVMNNGKTALGVSPSKATGLGPLSRSISKIVGKMQDLIEQ